MIQTRREDPPPTPSEILERRVRDLEERMHRWEIAQGNGWAWDVEAKGDAIEKKLSAMRDALEALSAVIDHFDEPIPAEERVRDFNSSLTEMNTILGYLLTLAEAIVIRFGLPAWKQPDEDFEEFLKNSTAALMAQAEKDAAR